MEPHEFDEYIGGKIKQSENTRGEGDMDGMTRVWSAIEPQLQKRISFHWAKIAAVILLLLVPSVYLYLRNREQGTEILTLNAKLTLIEKTYRQKLQAFTANQPERVIVQHDTIRLIKTVEKKIIPETVEIVKQVTDTVYIFQQAAQPERPVENAAATPSSDELNSTWQESPAKTEYILSKDASPKKKKKGRTFQISLGTGNLSSQTAPELALKTKL